MKLYKFNVKYSKVNCLLFMKNWTWFFFGQGVFSEEFNYELLKQYILNPTEVRCENVSDLRAKVQISVDPTDFDLVIV